MTFTGFAPPTENYSKLPHQLINELPQITTLGEMKVLLYVLRHTWGFQEFEEGKKITLDEFENGRKRRNGTRLDNGTGLAKSTIVAGLKSAVEHGFLEVEVDKSDKARVKKYYMLVIAENQTPEIQATENQTSSVAESNSDGTKVGHRTEKETKGKKLEKEPAAGAAEKILFDGLGTAYLNSPAGVDGYVEVQVSNLVDYFYCPECNHQQQWPKQESKRKKPQTLICQNRNCGVYFLVENEQTGMTYSVQIPEPEWILRFDSPFGALSRMTMTVGEFKQFQRNWQEDCGLVVEKIQWAAGQDWLAYQKAKVAGRVNAAFETAKKRKVSNAQPVQEEPPKQRVLPMRKDGSGLPAFVIPD